MSGAALLLAGEETATPQEASCCDDFMRVTFSQESSKVLVFVLHDLPRPFTRACLTLLVMQRAPHHNDDTDQAMRAQTAPHDSDATNQSEWNHVCTPSTADNVGKVWQLCLQEFATNHARQSD
jgi:hypothetical protein